MQSVLKVFFSVLPALGLLIFNSPVGAVAKPSVAFLGLDAGSDPLFHRELTRRIQRDLSADTALRSLSSAELAPVLDQRLLNLPEVGPAEAAKLHGLGAQFYAFGWLEPEALEVTRTWKKPWAVGVKWSQGLRLRVVDAGTGAAVYDAVVPAEISEKTLVFAPDAPDNRMGPVDRDRCQRRMLPLLAAEAAKAVAKVVVDRAAPSDSGAAAAPGAAGAEPAQ